MNISRKNCNFGNSLQNESTFLIGIRKNKISSNWEYLGVYYVFPILNSVFICRSPRPIRLGVLKFYIFCYVIGHFN